MLSDKIYKQGVERQLYQLGLSEVQAKIYISILHTQRTTVLQIARDTGIQRPTIYDNVAFLEKSLLVATVVEGGRKYIVPNNPENLFLLIKQKQNVAQEIAPSLMELYSREEKHEPAVRFFRGEEGLKKLADVILTCKEREIRTLADFERNIQKPFSERYLRTLWKARSRKHIFGKILYTHESIATLKKNKDYSDTGNIRFNREVRILPVPIKLSVLYTIVDNNVLFWGPKEEDVSFQFVSDAHANSLKSLFDYLWNVSKSIEFAR